MATSERVQVKCPECGEKRSLSLRQARRAGKCPFCRYPIKIIVNDYYKRFWTDRFSADEIQVLASAIFNDIPNRRPALVASSRILDEDQN